MRRGTRGVRVRRAGSSGEAATLQETPKMYSIARHRHMLVLGEVEHGRPLAQVQVLYVDAALPVLFPLAEVEQDARAQDAGQDDVEAVGDLVERRWREDVHEDVREDDQEDAVCALSVHTRGAGEGRLHAAVTERVAHEDVGEAPAFVVKSVGRDLSPEGSPHLERDEGQEKDREHGPRKAVHKL